MDETKEMILERTQRREEAARRFEQAGQALQAAFLRTLANEGAGAAYGLVKPLLRNPQNGLEDKAKVAEALRLWGHILQSNPEDEPALEGFRPLRNAMVGDLRALLIGPSISPQVQEIALGSVASFDIAFSFTGDSEILEEGVWTYDPTKPLIAVAHVRTHSRERNPSDLALLSLFAPLIRDPEADPYVRSALLVALDGRSVVGAPHPPLLGLATTDLSPLVRQAAIEVLGRHPDLLHPGEALTVLSGQLDASTREVAFKALGLAASKDAGFSNILIAALNATPQEGDQGFEVVLMKMAAVRVGVAAYQETKDILILGAFTERLEHWAKEKSSNELVAALAEEAARRGLRELEPFLRSIVPLIEEGHSRAQIQEALRVLAR